MTNLRSKTQVKEFGGFPTLEELPVWGFDGSSTRHGLFCDPTSFGTEMAEDRRGSNTSV